MTATNSSAHPETARQDQPKPVDPVTASWAVVGYDGSESSLVALTAVARLFSGRIAYLEVVYVAHVSTGASMSSEGVFWVREGFDQIARELTDGVRSALGDQLPTWHFQRRDGSVGEELVAAAHELRQKQGEDASIMIVVGSPEHLIHHFAGSVAATLLHRSAFPVLVVPARHVAAGSPDPRGSESPAQQVDTVSTDKAQRRQAASTRVDVVVERHEVEQVLRRAGLTSVDVRTVLDGVKFPSPLSAVLLQADRFGISTGSLMERLGSSP